MPDHREIELKLSFDPKDRALLARHPLLRGQAHRPVTRRLAALYFDTPDLALKRAGLYLRLRRDGRRIVQTVKRQAPAGPLQDRDEFEAVLDGETPRPELVPDPDLRAFLCSDDVGPRLTPVFATDIRRTRRMVSDGRGGEVCLDIDVGSIQAASGGEAAVAVNEIELELRSGSVDSLFAVALDLQRDLPLRLVPSSKAERGYGLVAGDPAAAPAKARAPALEPELPVGRAIAAVLGSGIEQVMANEAAVRAGIDPEGVHQMRVGLRRLRSALSLFADVLDPARRQAISSELKWLQSALGPARELDVFRAEALAPVAAAMGEEDGLRLLARRTDVAIALAYDAARGALASPRYTRLLLELARWQAAIAADSGLSGPVEPFAAALLERRLKSVRKAGRGLARAPVERQHDVRIRLKKLRYGADFFRSIFHEKHARRFIARMAAVQEILGHLNDGAVLGRVLAGVCGGDPALARAEGLVLGWHARARQGQLDGLKAAWRRFGEAEPFWRPG